MWRLLAFALVFGPAAGARAQAGPFYEPQALTPQGFELRLSAEYHAVERTDFSRPVFLIAQPLERLRARELAFEVDLRLSITPSVAVQIVLPWLARDVDVRSFGLQVTADQTLPSRSFGIWGWGLGDPLLALAYRFLDDRPWSAYAEFGAAIPIDDNPGSAVLATRVPLSTGQHELFLGGGVALERPLELSLMYRFGYSPGEHAAFLIRRTGTQTYTSGALAPFAHHRVRASAALALSRLFSVALTPSWTASEQPVLVDRSTRRQVVFERVLHEITLTAALRLKLGDHRVELRYTEPLLSSSDEDPFFPIVIVTRGVGVAWQLVGF